MDDSKKNKNRRFLRGIIENDLKVFGHDLKSQEIALAELRIEFMAVKEQINKISTIIRDSSYPGKTSILARLISVEDMVDNHEKKLVSYYEEAIQNKRTISQLKASLFIAIVTGLFGLVKAFWSYFVK